jgi:hypothetical protein
MKLIAACKSGNTMNLIPHFKIVKQTQNQPSYLMHRRGR